MVTELISGLSRELEGVEGVDVAIAPPTLYLDLAERMLGESSSNIILGAQNTDLNNSCAFTGDTSPEMLKDFGASHIIIGHSERREHHNESDQFVANKFNSHYNSKNKRLHLPDCERCFCLNKKFLKVFISLVFLIWGEGIYRFHERILAPVNV